MNQEPRILMYSHSESIGCKRSRVNHPIYSEGRVRTTWDQPLVYSVTMWIDDQWSIFGFFWKNKKSLNCFRVWDDWIVNFIQSIALIKTQRPNPSPFLFFPNTLEWSLTIKWSPERMAPLVKKSKPRLFHHEHRVYSLTDQIVIEHFQSLHPQQQYA